MQQIFHHYSVLNLSLKRQANAADWMPDAGVPIVFPGRGKKKSQNRMKKEQTKLFFLGIRFNELFLSSINKSQSMPLWRCRMKIRCWSPLGTNPDISCVGTQECGGSCSRGNCHRRSVSVEICYPEMPLFRTPCETPEASCTVEMDFLVWVHHLSVRASRKDSLCEIMGRSVFWGMEVEPALYKLSWI